MKRIAWLTSLASAVLLFVAGAAAASVAPSDSLITLTAQNCLFPACGPDLERIEAFTPQGSLISTVHTSSPSDMLRIASDRFGNLLGAGATLVKVNDDGSLTTLSVPLSEIGSISADQNGNVYVGQAHITKISPSGQIVATYMPNAPRAFSIDLSADQCTMYFTDGGAPTVYRFNVCQGVALPPLTTALPNGGPADLRVLPSGQILVADGNAGVVVVDSISGAIARTYPVPTQSLALSQDGTSFWAGKISVQRIDLQTGAILATVTFNRAGNGLNSLAVVGEPRAAFATAIPTESGYALALFIVTLAMVALRRLS